MIEVSTNVTWLPKVLKKWPLGSKIWIRWLYLDKTSLIQSPKEVENCVGHLSAMMNCPILLTATPARQSNSPSPLPYPPNQNLVKCLSNICLFVDKFHHKNSPNQNLVTDFPNIFILIFITICYIILKKREINSLYISRELFTKGACWKSLAKK